MTKRQKYLERVIFYKETLSTYDFTDYYKNYYILINSYFDICDFMKITIYKIDKKNDFDIKIAYKNNHKEEILNIFGKKFQNNSYETIHKKIIAFIKENNL